MPRISQVIAGTTETYEHGTKAASLCNKDEENFGTFAPLIGMLESSRSSTEKFKHFQWAQAELKQSVGRKIGPKRCGRSFFVIPLWEFEYSVSLYTVTTCSCDKSIE